MEGGANIFPCSSSSPNEVLDSLWIPSSSAPPPSSSFQGSSPAAVVEFTKRGRDTASFDKDEDGSEGPEGYYDNCFHQPGKKRRLTAQQVHFLEQSFEVENKLEPERKIQLAKELALQPRQVAIWFQNRRARYKTKTLEKEYGVLKSSYDQLKSDYDTLFKENQDLKNEVDRLTEKFLLREKGKAAESNAEPQKEPIAINGVIKQEEDLSPVKSDVSDSESPRPRSPRVLLAPDDSSHGFEPELSDFSQEEEDDHRFLQEAPIFPKLEDDCCYINGLSCSAGNLGFPVEDQSTWFWLIE